MTPRTKEMQLPDMQGVPEGQPLDRWKEWLTVIKDETLRMDVRRRVWRRYIEILNSNATLREAGLFHLWLTENYAAAQVLAVRRQVDRRQDVISLRRLLEAIAAQPAAITLKRFVSVSFSGNESLAARSAERLFQGSSLQAQVVRDDLLRLANTSEVVRNYANARLAHWSQQPWSASVTYGELHTAIDTLGSLLGRYSGLLFGPVQSSDVIPPWVGSACSVSRGPMLPPEAGDCTGRRSTLKPNAPYGLWPPVTRPRTRSLPGSSSNG